MSEDKYQIWDCKIVVPADAKLPNGFDWPPRQAAIAAVEAAGIEVIGCSSGWGGRISKRDERFMLEQAEQPNPGVYIAGTLDTEGGPH